MNAGPRELYLDVGKYIPERKGYKQAVLTGNQKRTMTVEKF